MNPDLIDRIMTKALRREQVLANLATVPRTLEPSDVKAERIVCAAALCGFAKPAELPVLGKHFFSEVRGAIFCMVDALLDAGLELRDDLLLRALDEQGIRGRIVAEELHTLRYETPVNSMPRLLELARRLVELHARRELSAQLERLGIELCLGSVSAAEARARLRSLGAPDDDGNC